MAAVPVVINGVMLPKGKAAGDKPVPCTIIGYAYNPTLHVDTGPVQPPPDIPVEPPLVIWPNPPEGQAPLPSHPIALPGDPWWPTEGPPDQPPTQVEKPHEGWNWSAAKSQWYWLYVPDKGAAQPKK